MSYDAQGPCSPSANDSRPDAIGEVPATRWDVSAARVQNDGVVARRARHGGFVRGAHIFDNGRFGVSPAEAAAMDPQQRLLLERGYEALHGGGREQQVLEGSVTGVFLGIAAMDYGEVLKASPAGRSVYAAGLALSTSP